MFFFFHPVTYFISLHFTKILVWFEFLGGVVGGGGLLLVWGFFCLFVFRVFWCGFVFFYCATQLYPVLSRNSVGQIWVSYFPTGAESISVCKYIGSIHCSWSKIYFTLVGTDWKRVLHQVSGFGGGPLAYWSRKNVFCGKWFFISSKTRLAVRLKPDSVLCKTMVQTVSFSFSHLPDSFLCHSYHESLEVPGVSFCNSIRNKRLWRKN